MERYAYKASETFASFTFDSEGPNGKIRKVINYSRVGKLPNGIPVYNLGFGDWNEALKKVDDSTVSNNGDRDKVLATVACTSLDFCERYGRSAFLFEGVTPGKTRLYQMGINAHLAEIQKSFDIFGVIKGEAFPFEPGRNYEAFLAMKKES